jgi:hypothetical protein
MFIWNILSVLVSCTKENLATLCRSRSAKKIQSHFRKICKTEKYSQTHKTLQKHHFNCHLYVTVRIKKWLQKCCRKIGTEECEIFDYRGRHAIGKVGCKPPRTVKNSSDYF